MDELQEHSFSKIEEVGDCINKPSEDNLLLDLLDLNGEEFAFLDKEDCWLTHKKVNCSECDISSSNVRDWLNFAFDTESIRNKRRLLVNKLDELAYTSPNRTFDTKTFSKVKKCSPKRESFLNGTFACNLPTIHSSGDEGRYEGHHNGSYVVEANETFSLNRKENGYRTFNRKYSDSSLDGREGILHTGNDTFYRNGDEKNHQYSHRKATNKAFDDLMLATKLNNLQDYEYSRNEIMSPCETYFAPSSSSTPQTFDDYCDVNETHRTRNVNFTESPRSRIMPTVTNITRNEQRTIGKSLPNLSKQVPLSVANNKPYLFAKSPLSKPLTTTRREITGTNLPSSRLMKNDVGKTTFSQLPRGPPNFFQQFQHRPPVVSKIWPSNNLNSNDYFRSSNQEGTRNSGLAKPESKLTRPAVNKQASSRIPGPKINKKY